MKNHKFDGKLFVVYGPSGVGKTTIVREVIKRISTDYDIEQVATYTCRQPRVGEVNGRDYYFISHDEFEKKKNSGFFLETNDYINKHYGSPASIIDDLELGKNLILVTDRNGVKAIHKIVHDAILIWIETSIPELKKRIQKRGSETDHQLEERLKLALQEIEEEHKQRNFTYSIVNSDLDTSIAEMVLIIKGEL